jgi:hypothetical protein
MIADIRATESCVRSRKFGLRANTLWGAPRIHGELLKLGVDVAERTVSQAIPRRDSPPSKSPPKHGRWDRQAKSLGSFEIEGCARRGARRPSRRPGPALFSLISAERRAPPTSAVLQSPIRAIQRVYFGMACSGTVNSMRVHRIPVQLEPKTVAVLPQTGRLQREWRRCGKPTCRCTSGMLHGPYWHLRWRDRGRQRRRYVPCKQVDATRAALEQRRRLRPPAWSLRQALAELRQLTKEVQHVGHDE